MKKKIIYSCLFLFLIIAIFNIFQTKDVRQPTSEELNKYLKEQDVSPIVIKNIDKWSLVLSENWFLSLSVYKDSGKIGSLRTQVNNPSTEPVDAGLISWGDKKERIYVATIIINNKHILERAIKVKVKLNSSDNSVEETKAELMNNKKGAIIFFNNIPILDGKLSEVIIYDKDNKQIFNKNYE
ncbi:hypothetical protein [Clostridium estertheticum]|uniref:hypothetical protein n=1 Tax=Clostridium estertheticum TaxID=238834 RepID=UPI00124F76D6|nr:hypothetical protein [Clostridium estertheticum]MBU3174370.1 hypothetical protein [Clostridium estertheticum]MBZ9618586.1 hypothetical protein [Clostridium estertheticum subsp. laramiense]WAG76423.1 hypothetical protein LL032_24455 [Clostridium estertheticum]